MLNKNSGRVTLGLVGAYAQLDFCENIYIYIIFIHHLLKNQNFPQ